jgi:YHS domain-containing protein
MLNMKNIILAILSLLIYGGIASAQPALRAKQFNLEKGLAIQGYDPVAYFTLHQAVEGNKQYTETVDGVKYYFSSASNKNLFLKDPKKYEPQYGGWCAYAMGATNEKVEIDPETFKIVDGKLYLFYHSWVNNTLSKWNDDEANLKRKADTNWASKYR